MEHHDAQELAAFIPYWLTTRKIIDRHNTLDAIPNIIGTEKTEFLQAIDDHAQSEGYDSPLILEEVADLMIFTLQMLYRLGHDLTLILTETTPTDHASLTHAVDSIGKHSNLLQAKSRLHTEREKTLSEITRSLLAALLGFCSLLEVSAVHVTYSKAEYIKHAMPEEIWSQSNLPPADEFSIARKQSKDYQQEHYPKETYLFPILARQRVIRQ
jgi:phosphoribosyl-ATP pyrophosphohydrolase